MLCGFQGNKVCEPDCEYYSTCTRKDQNIEEKKWVDKSFLQKYEEFLEEFVPEHNKGNIVCKICRYSEENPVWVINLYDKNSEQFLNSRELHLKNRTQTDLRTICNLCIEKNITLKITRDFLCWED